jgi:hypothetical protein
VKKNVIYLIFAFSILFVKAQIPPNYRFVKTWRVNDRFAFTDSIPVDTVPRNYQISNPIDRFSIANSFNGNLGSPIQSKLYFDRPTNNDFIFSSAYYPYLMNIEHATFYKTKTPYSNLDYNTGGSLHRDEDHVKFIFTANPNKYFNIGTTLDYMYAPGEYTNQAAQRFSGSLFGSFQGKHYSATALFATNNINNYDNGGIANSNDITSPISGVLPINFVTNIKDGEVAYSNYKQTQLFYNQQYSIGFERKIQVSKDSVRMEYVPVTRFAHTLKYDDLRKRYYERQVISTPFYVNTYLPFLQTNDTSALQTVSNTFSVSMAEEFNKWMKFGLTAFIENEIQNYTYNKDSLVNNKWQSNTKVGGVLSKQRGQAFKYNVLGELCFLGFKAGDFRVEANVGGYFKLLKDSISLVANGFVRSDKPSYFLQHYQSNHFRWDNNFLSVYRTHIGGTFSIPTRHFSLNVSVENITDFVYFDTNTLPAQFLGNIQVLAANAKLDFHIGKFWLENNVVYQLSSQPGILALPDLTLYHNLYYNDLWFNVLTIQLGVNLRYHTIYYAPTYMPATGQFYNQTTTKIGNYPVATAYLNMHLKRTRFFVEYYHVNQMFMTGPSFSMPNYPINPANLKLGISWNFYD